jgi:cell division protein FtsQ
MSTGLSFKLAAWLTALALIGLPIAGLLNGWFASDRWPLKQLRIDAEFRRVNAEQIRAAVTPRIGVGFFAVDLDGIRAAVEELPWVERAEVRKRWPDQLDVVVVERRAAAIWAPNRLVSTTGKLFSVPGESLPEGLPRLAGPDARVADVLAFYREHAQAFAGAGRPLAIAGVTLSERGSWSLELDTGARVVVGREAPRARLVRFVEALARIEAPVDTALVRADLRYANGFAIEWRAVEPPPAPAGAAPTDAPPAAPAPELHDAPPSDVESPHPA